MRASKAYLFLKGNTPGYFRRIIDLFDRTALVTNPSLELIQLQALEGPETCAIARWEGDEDGDSWKLLDQRSKRDVLSLKPHNRNAGKATSWKLTWKGGWLGQLDTELIRAPVAIGMMREQAAYLYFTSDLKRGEIDPTQEPSKIHFTIKLPFLGP